MTTVAPASAPETDVDLFSDEVLYDPFPHYKALRDLGPVVYLTRYDLYGLFRYDRVRAALRDWQTFSSAPGIAFNEAVNARISGQSILAMDPPAHTAVRKVFDDSLKPKFIRRAAGDIEQRAAELVDEVVARQEFDGVRDFARRLPVDIVMDLVGLPRDENRAKVLDWVQGTFNTFGPEGERWRRALPAFLEGIRMECPAQMFSRVATRDVEFEGVTIPEGARVLHSYGSANRDERHYPDPDRFDVRRNPTDTVAFDIGVHTCPGRTLSSMEGEALLSALARRVAKIELTAEPTRSVNNITRGLDALPIRVS